MPLATLFVSLYLLVPIICILLLSYRTPKFNPRYLMLASPALVLLLAGGLGLPFARRRDDATSPRSRVRAMQTLAGVALAAVATVFLLADRNWFLDPAFTKDDWRGAVAAVRSQLKPDEAVVLVSGHALPAWRYYAPEVEPLRLPELEILDVNAVLDVASAGSLLDNGLAGKQGAWLVQWQNGVVDPTGVVSHLLRTAGTQEPVTNSFWGLGSPEHYRWPAETSFQSLAGNTGQAVHANFGNQVELVGFTQPACDQPDCPITLFWRALAPLAADYKLNATLMDPTLPDAWGEPVDRRLAAYDYPTFRWQPGSIVLSQLPLNASQGTPPGEYRLRVGVYDAATGQALDLVDSAGAAQGRWAWLDPVSVSRLVLDGPTRPAPGPTVDSPTQRRFEPSVPVEVASGIDLGGLVELVGITVDGEPAVRPGATVPVTVTWRARQPMDTSYTGFVHLLNAGNAVVAQDDHVPLVGRYPTTRWLTGEVVEDRYELRLPADLPPGDYTFEIGLYDANRSGLPRLKTTDGRDSILLGRAIVAGE